MKSSVVVHVQGMRDLELDGVTIRLNQNDSLGNFQIVLLDGLVLQIESTRIFCSIADALIELGWAVKCAIAVAKTGTGGVINTPPQFPAPPLAIDETEKGG